MKFFRLLVFCFCISSITAYALPDSFLKMVSMGGPKSLDEAFVLLEKADANEKADLTAAIEKSIIKSPKSFLKALKKHNTSKNNLDEVVAEFDVNILNDKEAKKKEAKERIDSLKSVPDQDLQAIRDQCITNLENKVKQL